MPFPETVPGSGVHSASKMSEGFDHRVSVIIPYLIQKLTLYAKHRKLF